MIVTRFAPSPTGLLHLGHAASALFAFDRARQQNGTFLLRIEDIDPVRCKEPFIQAIEEDLQWLGLDWPTPVRCQSRHLSDYQKALQKLRSMGVLYPCYCTRKEVQAEAAAAGHAPHIAPDGGEGLLYPGTCRRLTEKQRRELESSRQPVWRLDMQKALSMTGELSWTDERTGLVKAKPERFGDVVLARKDVPTSYHLSVVVDDALQGVTCVTRGEDLFQVTDIHCLLQALLDLPTPTYHHHTLLVDSSGRRLAKRDHSLTLRALREQGATPDEVRQKIPLSFS
ncbi:MAG: tRNA glutamyl-Q(34) synthetase GluQRS [Bdellovibrionales bacterium]